MGDHFQSVVDRDATRHEAPVLADRILQWLFDEGVVSREATDCVLGSDLGYPPAANYHKITTDTEDDFLRFGDGLDVVTE
ncbi:MAG: hypothetical protein ACR2OV_12425, partial [Hyphomicrobiaceae bacterium]